MGKKLISDKVKSKYKKSIQKVIEDLGKAVSVYTSSRKNECPNCYFDNVNNKSSGKCKWSPVEAANKQAEWESAGNTSLRYKYFTSGRCPVCEGDGYLQVIRRRYVKSIVNWGGERTGLNETVQTPAGKEGSTEVVLKTYPMYMELFRDCNKIKVDGVYCELSDPPLVRGPGKDSVLIITAYATEVSKKGKSNVIKGYYE